MVLFRYFVQTNLSTFPWTATDSAVIILALRTQKHTQAHWQQLIFRNEKYAATYLNNFPGLDKKGLNINEELKKNYCQLVLSASDVRLKIFAYAFSLWEKCCGLSAFDNKLVMFMNDFGNFNKKCTGWKRFYLIADDIGKWYSFKNLCSRLWFMRKPLLFKCVWYAKKLAEKCSAALKSVMFMNDFGNFNKKCTGWKRFHLIADDIGKWYAFKNLCLRL